MRHWAPYGLPKLEQGGQGLPKNNAAKFTHEALLSRHGSRDESGAVRFSLQSQTTTNTTTTGDVVALESLFSDDDHGCVM